MRKWVSIVAMLGLTACGGGSHEAALEACFASAEAALQRDGGSSEIDRGRSEKTLSVNPDGTIELRVVSFLSKQGSQPQQQDFACKVRFTEGKPTPDVISFTFLWEAASN